MDEESLQAELREALAGILTMDVNLMHKTIERCYDNDCVLQNPFMILNGRDEIIRSYEVLISANIDMAVEVNTITYDSASLIAMVDLFHFSNPKALGGLVPLKIHQILKLQLEAVDVPPVSALYKSTTTLSDSTLETKTKNSKRKLVVVNHNEIHVAQTHLSQLPVVGNLYDTGIRSALGQLTLAGGGILEYTGVLDIVPWAVSKVGRAAHVAGEAAGAVVGGAKATVRATGVPSLVGRVIGAGGWAVGKAQTTMGWVADEARDTAATFIESGKSVKGMVGCADHLIITDV